MQQWSQWVFVTSAEHHFPKHNVPTIITCDTRSLQHAEALLRISMSWQCTRASGEPSCSPQRPGRRARTLSIGRGERLATTRRWATKPHKPHLAAGTAGLPEQAKLPCTSMVGKNLPSFTHRSVSEREPDKSQNHQGWKRPS